MTKFLKLSFGENPLKSQNCQNGEKSTKNQNSSKSNVKLNQETL